MVNPVNKLLDLLITGFGIRKMKYRFRLQWSSPKKMNEFFFVKIFSRKKCSNSNNVCTADDIYLIHLKIFLEIVLKY